MGLDMYIRHGTDEDWPENVSREVADAFYKDFKSRELCYWRKHPNLHGYIVQTFAEGIDECQEIDLTREMVQQILKASEKDKLPDTQGFFFGQSFPEDKEDTRIQLTALLEWMRKNPGRRVFYRASW